MMKTDKLTYVFIFISIFLSLYNSGNTQVLSENREKYWIFFKDKGPQRLDKDDSKNFAAELDITQRALQRRSKIREQLIDWRDMPVYRGYVRILQKEGMETVVRSRWLNGISVITTQQKIKKIKSYSFIRKTQPVVSFIRELPEPAGLNKPESGVSIEDHTYDYGPSYLQNRMIRVPDVHDLGLYGQGILIGMIDTGFDYQGREVFAQMDIIKEYDFHWDDSTTANQQNDPPYQHNHGTQTLSVIGGFWEGNLIGPAFEASYILAKTEWVPSETKIEEDHWVEALEWMEREGADIVSTSLGYSEFDGGIGYTYNDMNGNICVTTRAADIAVSKGMIVVASAGNERNGSWFYIVSPADGDSVLAAGAVTPNGEITSFSSAGPTSDGRIKPDMVAMGSSVAAASTSDLNGLSYVGGTSFSCPLIAGVCALVLQAHPELHPMQIHDALKGTADRKENPDNLYGWGLVDAYEAVFYHGVVFTNFRSTDVTNESYQGVDMDIVWKYAVDPDSVYLYYKQTENSPFTAVKMNALQPQSYTYRALVPTDIDLATIKFYVSVRDSLHNKYVGPIGAPDILYEGLITVNSPEINIDKIFKLSQNYPNPFNGYTYFPLILTKRAYVKMNIYNILGRKVKTVYNDYLSKGVYTSTFTWDGTNDQGISITSGIYILQTTVDKVSQTCKIVYVK